MRCKIGTGRVQGTNVQMTDREHIDTSPKSLPVDPSRQLLPVTFENEVPVKAYVSNANIKRSGRIMRSHL